MTTEPKRERPGGRASETVTLGGAGSEEIAVVPLAWLQARRDATRGRVEASDRHHWWVLVVVLTGLLSVNFTFTLFAVAQTRIARELNTDQAGLTLAITLPLLAFGVAAPAMGKVGDVFGHRRLYLVGMGGAAVGSLASALAPSVGVLAGVRTVGQVFGAATGSASMALIFSVFDVDERVKAMGWWSLVGAGGPVIGVVVGGPVIEAYGWRTMFFAQAPLTVAAAVLAYLVLPSARPDERTGRPSFDVAGIATLSLGVTSLLLALNRGRSWGWSSPGIFAAVAFAVVMLVGFVSVEKRAAEPVLPLSFLRRRNFVLPMGAQALSNFAYMGGFILAPKLLADVYGYGESRQGLVSIARPLTFSVLSPIAGYLAVRVGERVSAVGGNALIVASMVVFSGLSASSGAFPVVLALALSGAGMGISSPSLTATVANEVDEERLGVASAALQLVNQVGLVAGIQLMSTVQQSRLDASGLSGSFRDAFRVGAAVCVLAVVCSAFVRRSTRRGVTVVGDRPPAGTSAAAR